MSRGQRAFWCVICFVLYVFGWSSALSSGSSAWGLATLKKKQVAPQQLQEHLKKALKDGTARQDYGLLCGGTTPSTITLKGFRVTNLQKLLDGLRFASMLMGGQDTTMTAPVGPATNQVGVDISLGLNGADCAVPSKNSRKKGKDGNSVTVVAADDTNVIALGGKGGNGCAGWRTPTDKNRDNANGGDGGNGGKATVTWTRHCVVLGIGGKGGQGGSWATLMHPVGERGKAGSGGKGGDVALTWDDCSVVGAIGGNGGFPNSAGFIAQDHPPADDNPDPTAPTGSTLTQAGGDGGSITMSCAGTPNRAIIGLTTGAVGGNGAQGAKEKITPFIGPGGKGGDVTRKGTGAGTIPSSGGPGGAGTQEGGPVNGTVTDRPIGC